MKYISSTQNSSIKDYLLLQEKSKHRKEKGLFVIDGWKEIQMALSNQYTLQQLFIAESVVAELSDAIEQVKATVPSIECLQVSDAVFEKLAYRGLTSKAVAVANTKYKDINLLPQHKNPIYIILDGIEKPGNLGAILRIADAANVTAILCCDTKTDIYNPNVIRSSVGCLFTQQVAVATKETIYQFLQQQNIAIYTSSLKSAISYTQCNFKGAVAFVFGTEATGVINFWEECATQNIIIPMHGQNDSLNVSNAVAVITFETLRQRTN